MRVSVLMPVYNMPDLVITALNSVPRREDLEIIVVDDCSTDSTYDIVHDYLVNSALNYTHLRNDRNMHCGMSLNKAIEYATGEYITQLDSDDAYFTEEINRVIDMADTDLVWFNLKVNDGRIWSPNTMKEICDHSCLYRRSLVGDTRYPDLPNGAGRYFHDNIIRKPHTERYTNITAYKYNFPRVGSVLYNANKKNH